AVCPRGGGIRDYFRKGNITVNDVISVMPFEDYLVEFLIKGEDLQTELKTSLSGPFISGIKFMDGTYKIFVDGEFRQLESNKLYSGIMLDYSYFLKGFEKYEFNETHIHYRDPVIKYFKTLDSLQDHKFNILNSISTGDSSNTSETVISSEKESSGTISTISSVNVLIIFSVLISAVFIRRKKSRR
ncbi:MAG: 5'-nucleotidase C-terminal domain-containing protein, partial [Candidatus Thorarchaeota archaeon]